MKYLALILTCVCVISVSAQTSDSPYDKEYGYDEGLCRVEYKGKFGYIDEKKKEVIEIQYKAAGDFSDGVAKVSLDGKLFGYINKQGKTVVPLEYTEFMYGFIDGLTPAKKNGKWGTINDKGKTVIPHEYDYLYYHSDGLAIAGKNAAGGGKIHGYLDEKGKTVIPFEFEDANLFYDGLALVKKNGQYGYIDLKGKTVVPCQYAGGKRFSEGYAAVKSNGKWGFIDKSNKYVITPAYDKVESFNAGEAQVLKGEKAWFIDKTGKQLPAGRWLFVFTKGLKIGEQFWYRGTDLNDEALKAKYKEGYRYYDVAQNQNKREYFIVMSKFNTSWQTGVNYRYDNDQAWERIKEFYKDSRCITSLSYGQDKWSMIATDLGRNPQESAVTNSTFPHTSVEEHRKNGKYITTMAYGNGKWFVIVRPSKYDGQEVRTFYGGWDQEVVDAYRKKDYYVTAVAVEDDDYYVVFTKGMGIKEQVFLWDEDIPMREINQHWSKGYQSYRSYYLPRYTTLDKNTDYDFLDGLFDQ